MFHRTYHAKLTGLPNCLLFNDRLKVAISFAQRKNSGFAFMTLGLDKFKIVSDSMGYDIVDLLL